MDVALTSPQQRQPNPAEPQPNPTLWRFLPQENRKRKNTRAHTHTSLPSVNAQHALQVGNGMVPVPWDRKIKGPPRPPNPPVQLCSPTSQSQRCIYQLISQNPSDAVLLKFLMRSVQRVCLTHQTGKCVWVYLTRHPSVSSTKTFVMTRNRRAGTITDISNWTFVRNLPRVPRGGFILL